MFIFPSSLFTPSPSDAKGLGKGWPIVPPRIRHGVHRKSDVEAMLIRLTCGGFHAGSGSHASKDYLRDAFRFQS
jgi:hypothetical protein